ncbi:TetR/AcrR family transcriptional regulator [Pseudonocardia endophytica]|uniref:TetR family transcriptional regulator n=1 Tax=Pseudonocardia endophytica TaxID=401976 RepID=A0A4R1HK02_PSEEN|nr:TetR/AcrR family transcriptional regulator [Pseudonocardia endophytica]TCK22188.1 TetR family transcriptional regulator [Pseudonocardia endophytica]
MRAELTRERILDAAAHVFAEYGYAGGTTNRIAERARCSIGSLYQYFPNKDAILGELLTRHLDAGVAARAPLGEGSEQTTLDEVVRVMVRTAIANHRDDPRLLRLLIEEAPMGGDVLRRIEEHQRRRVDALQGFLTRHREVRVEDTETAARIITMMVEIVVHGLSATSDRVDEHRLESELTAMITRYLCAPEY